MHPTRAFVPLFVFTLIAHAASAAPLVHGDLVVTDQFTAAVLRIDPVSGAQSAISAGGLLVSPTGVAVDDAGVVYVIDATGIIVRVDPAAFDAAHPGDNQALVSSGGLLTTPQDGAFDGDGTLLVAVQGGSKLVRVDPAAFEPLTPDANQTLVASGDLLSAPKDVAVDRATGAAYVTCFSTDRVVQVLPNGTQSLVASQGFLNGLLGIAREADGHLIVRGGQYNSLIRVDPTTYSAANPVANQQAVSAGGFLSIIQDVAVEANGDVVATDFVLNHVTRVDPSAYDAAHPDANQTLVSPQGDLTSPLAIAVFAPEPSASLLAAVAATALTLLRRSRSIGSRS